MMTQSDEDNESVRVRCELCLNQVWIRQDRLQKHIQKVHPPSAASKKSFTTYKARIASTFPPKVPTQAITVKPVGWQAGTNRINLISRKGQRVGSGVCSECGVEQVSRWHYSESNQGPVDICTGCKQSVFERSFGK